MGRKAAISQTRDGRYLFVIYSEIGFSLYRLFSISHHYKRMIRKLAKFYKAELPRRINWDALPQGDFAEKFDGEEGVRIK